MKKFLSLVLALVMTMSLVTVSAGAKDFTDDGKINYEEAVDVMSAVKVIDGYANGSFNPQGTLTRGAAAKIICNLILGPTTAAALSADTAPYKDVPTDHTFAGYISYCAKEGIISGYADGTFRPAATLTSYAFMKMLLGALGYDSEIEQFVGSNWSINVAKRALAIGLTKGLDGTFNGITAVTREEACLYALNTLKATMVEYDAKITANVNGATVVVGNSVANDVKWNIASNTDGNIKDDGYVQFAEKYFPKLELETGNGIYGRPTNVWKNKKAEIGSYTSIDATQVYTETTDEDDIYADLGKAVCTEYDWSAYVNGKPVAAKNVDVVEKADKDYAYTGEGTVTEIYVDDDAETVTVCEINYYIGQVSKVKSDDDGEYIVVTALSKEPKLDDKTFYVEGYTEDDYVVFTVDYNDDKDFVIGEVCEPNVVSAEVTRVENDTDSDDTYLKADGEKYTYADKGHMVFDLDKYYTEDHPALSEEYDLYLDPNGFVLAFAAAKDTVDQYLYVIDSDEEMGDWTAKVLLATGEVVKVALEDEYIDKSGADKDIDWKNADKRLDSNIDAKVWKYTVSSKNVYELTEVDAVEFGAPKDKSDKYVGEIHNGKAYITDGKNDIIVDKKTTFVDYDNETAYVGYKAVPDVEKAHGWYVKDNKVATVVFILDGTIYDANSTYFMLTKDTRESLKFDGKYFWDYSKAYVAGDKQNVVVGYNAYAGGKLVAGELYKGTKTNSEGYFTEVEKVTGTIGTDVVMAGTVEAVGDETFWITNVKDQKRKFDTDEKTVFVYVETDKDGDIAISEGNINDMKAQDDYTTTVWVVKASNDKETADLVYIFATEKGVTPVTPVSKDIVLVKSDAINNYEDSVFFVENNRTLAKAEMQAALFAQMKEDGCTDIKLNGTTMTYTKNGVEYTVSNVTMTQMNNGMANVSGVKYKKIEQVVTGDDTDADAVTMMTVKLTDNATKAEALYDYSNDVNEVGFYLNGSYLVVKNDSTTTLKDIINAEGFAGYFVLKNDTNGAILYVKVVE